MEGLTWALKMGWGEHLDEETGVGVSVVWTEEGESTSWEQIQLAMPRSWVLIQGGQVSPHRS